MLYHDTDKVDEAVHILASEHRIPSTALACVDDTAVARIPEGFDSLSGEFFELGWK